jgi:hypothetical protein
MFWAKLIPATSVAASAMAARDLAKLLFISDSYFELQSFRDSWQTFLSIPGCSDAGQREALRFSTDLH